MCILIKLLTYLGPYIQFNRRGWTSQEADHSVGQSDYVIRRRRSLQAKAMSYILVAILCFFSIFLLTRLLCNG